MKLLKKIGITISIVWTIITLVFIGWQILVGPNSCGANTGEKVSKLTGDIPEFEFELLDENTTVTNESIAGNYTLLYFWSTSCSICVKEMPYLHETYNELKGNNFDIVAISYDESEEDVREFMGDKYPMPWKNSVITGDRQKKIELLKSFGFQGSPYKVLVSPEGEVIESYSGFSGEDLTEQIRDQITS